MKPFRLYEPTTIDETISVLRELGEGGKLYAGGTELLLAMKVGLLSYDGLVNVKQVDGLDGVAVKDGALTIGATATHAAIEDSSDVQRDFPLIARVEHGVANIRVRNVGTMVGNLCFAEPHSDPAALLLLYEATVDAFGQSGQRSIPIEDLIVGPYETSLDEEEVVTRVRIPSLPTGMRGTYLKFGYHRRPTIGVGAAVSISNGKIDDVRLSLGSVPSQPVRLRASESVLRDASLDDDSALAEAGRLAADSADAIDDLHGSADYKRHLVDVFLRRAVAQAIEQGVR